MNAERARAIQAHRLRQPVEELKRKAAKAVGRYSSQRCAQETLDEVLAEMAATNQVVRVVRDGGDYLVFGLDDTRHPDDVERFRAAE